MVAVRWCEAEVRSFEWTNTFSNLIFALTAYVGWRLAKDRGLPFEFVAAELLLIVVFVGFFMPFSFVSNVCRWRCQKAGLKLNEAPKAADYAQ